jgi:flagellar FliJ protein
MNKRFRFQSILDFKQHKVDQLQQELACKQQELERLRGEIRMLEEKRDRAATQLRHSMSGVLPIDTIRHTYQYLAHIDQQIANGLDKIRTVESQVETVRASLTEALKDRKTFEKLREYTFADLRAQENRREMATADDLNIARYFHNDD